MDKSKILRISDKIAMALLCVLMVDIGIFGAGKVVYVGPLSFRHALLLLLAVASVPLMLAKWRELAKHPFMWMIFVFFAWQAVSAVIGVVNSHRTSLIITDLKGFAFFAFLPVFLCVLRTRERVHLVMKALVVSSAVLALITVACLVVYLLDRQAIINFSAYGYEIQFSRIGCITAKIPRLYFMSGLYMLCGCAFGIYFQVVEKDNKFSWLYSVVTGLCLFALLLSYTRSVYLAIVVAAVVTVLAMLLRSDLQSRKKLLIHIVTAACVCLCLIGIFTVVGKTNYLGYAFSRTAVSLEQEDTTPTETMPADAIPTETEPPIPTEPPTELSEEEYWQQSYNEETAASDALRLTTTQQLWENIRKSPLIGLGLGAEIASRPEGLNEYIYLDVWSKAGIVGLVLYFVPLLWMFLRIAKNGEEDICNRREKSVWVAVLLGFMAYSYFNPYMNGSMGVIFYCCTMAIAQQKQKPLPGNDGY